MRLISAFAHKPLTLLLGVLSAVLACKTSANSNSACCFSVGKVLITAINASSILGSVCIILFSVVCGLLEVMV